MAEAACGRVRVPLSYLKRDSGPSLSVMAGANLYILQNLPALLAGIRQL